MNERQIRNRHDKITGLRALADWLDTHPDAPVPTVSRDICDYVQADDDATGIAQVWEIAEPLGLSVTVGGDEASCSVQFGGGISWSVRYLYRDRRAAYVALMSYSGAVVAEGGAR